MRQRLFDGKKPAFFILLLCVGCAAVTPESERAAGSNNGLPIPTTARSTTSVSTIADDPAWAQISAVLKQPGAFKDDVYTIAIPRDDLDVDIEGMAVPMSAGLQTTFWFYRCPCGKMNLIGQFVTADYEANDVVDALRGGQMKVVTVAPALLYEKPRLLMIRFQAEGDPIGMAEILHDALRWTGKQRMAPRKLD